MSSSDPSKNADGAAVRSTLTLLAQQASADNAFDAVMAQLMEIQYLSTVALNKLVKLQVEYRMALTDDTPPDPDDA